MSRPPFDPKKPSLEFYERLGAVPDSVWMAIREAIAAGVPLEVVSSRSGVPEGWISARAEKQDWLTPEKRERIVAQYGLMDYDQLSKVKDELALAAAAVSADEALRHRAMVAKNSTEKLRESFDSGVLTAPMTWKDAKIADEMARKAYGLENGEKQQTIIQLGALTEVSEASEEVIDI
jgi:hypothetical protein